MTSTSSQVHFPRVLRIEPSAACNLSCIHCPTGTIDMSRGIMRQVVFDKVLEAIRRNLSSIQIVVMYHGGEPLLNRNFYSMVRQVREAGVPIIKTVSNGMLLRETDIEELFSCGLDTIEFSLDGSSESENNLLRRNSDYKKVIANIRRLLEARHERKLTTPTVELSHIRILDPAVDDPLILPTPSQHLVQDIAGPWDPINIKAFWAIQWPHMKLDDTLFDTWVDPRDQDKKGCDHVENTITVRADGTVVPCCFDLTTKMPMGNVLESNLEDIWASMKYAQVREALAGGQYPSICSRCFIVRKKVYLTYKKSGLSDARKDNSVLAS